MHLWGECQSESQEPRRSGNKREYVRSNCPDLTGPIWGLNHCARHGNPDRYVLGPCRSRAVDNCKSCEFQSVIEARFNSNRAFLYSAF
jgi:hypothetical protein